MLNVVNDTPVYKADEIDRLIRFANGYEIVDELPPIASANIGLVYYKKTDTTVPDIKGYRRADDTDNTRDLYPTPTALYNTPVYQYLPALLPYVIGKDNTGHRIWCTMVTDVQNSAPLSDAEILEIWHNYDYISPVLTVIEP